MMLTYMFAIYRKVVWHAAYVCIVLQLPDDGHSMWPKYVVVLSQALDNSLN
jgi:hypothetical protein